MHSYIIDMVKKDVTAQWLMGDKLKNDQLCFLYEVTKIIYSSPLKQQLINKDKDLVEQVIPKLAAFKALLVIKNILQVKIEEKNKAKNAKLIDKEKTEEVEEEKKEEVRNLFH